MDIKKIALVSLLSSTVMLGGCNLCGSSTKTSDESKSIKEKEISDTHEQSDAAESNGKNKKS